MAQSSGPISQGTTAERQFSDVLWRARFGDEPGVLGDMNGTSYALTLPGSGTNVSIGSATQQSTATVAGFVHTIPAGSPETISIPDAVGVTRTDIISLRYNPANTGLPGPVRLHRIAGTTSALPTYEADTVGVEDLPLWSITRAVGQSITQATVKRMFPYLAPSMDIPVGAVLPSNSPLGSVVQQGATTYRRVLGGGGVAVWTADAALTNYRIGTRSTTPSSTGYISVTHGLGATPTAVFIQNRIAASFAHTFVVTEVNSTTFTVRVYYNNAPATSGSQSFFWRVET